MERFSPPIREQILQAYLAARGDPKAAETNGRLGMILQAYDEFDLAARYYKRARMLDPESFRWIYYLALVQSASGQNDLAITNLRKALQLIASYLPARLKLAELLMAEGNLAESRKIYHALIQEQPGLTAWACRYVDSEESSRVTGDTAAAVDHYEPSL